MRIRAFGVALLGLSLVFGGVGETTASATTTVLNTASATPGADALRPADRRILAGLPDGTTVGIHAETGRVRFLGGTAAHPLMRPAALRRAALNAQIDGAKASGTLGPGVAARAFLDQTGPMFGVARPGRISAITRIDRLGSRGSVVRFQQTRRGVPVLGGELVVRLDRRGAVLSASGEVLPSADAVDTQGSVSSSVARRAAADWLARSAGVGTRSVTTTSEGLTILDERILGGPDMPGPRLVWSIDARAPQASDGIPEHRQVLVDADTGVVLDSIDRVAEGLDRRVCDFKSRRTDDFRCRSDYSRVEGQAPSSSGQVNAAYRLMGVVDAFYRDRFGRDGLDDQGERMVATVRYCSLIQCPLHNAFWEWGPQQAAFGNGWASADDLVGHEFTHGVLDHEARLFYTYQSGALNEAFADIFGEFIDLTYPGGKDTAGTRWVMGEDLPGGAVRDLRNPGRFGNPDRIRSSRYSVGSYDDGGVHINSAVGAKAAVLMTDGGTFNGYTIKGLGLTKTALIVYEAMSDLLTSAADYNDLYNALQQACVNLVGSHGIRFSDCKSVRQAVRATEMQLRPRSGAPRVASVCPAGKASRTTWASDFEDRAETLSAWDSRVIHATRNVWYYPQNPNNDSDWDGTWASSGKRNLFGDDPPKVSDSAMAMTEGVKLPSGARMRFEHGFQFDADAHRRYDGGVVELSVDGGSWRDARSYFVQGGYTGTITSGTRNPLKGRRAFTGPSRGWGSSRLDLSSLAGHTVRFRFRIGTDRSSGSLGWYIDDVQIYRCVSDGQAPTGSIELDGGADATTDGMVDVSIVADGTGSSLSRLLISNSSSTSGGILRDALEMPFRETITDWSLSSTTWGGSGGHGTRRVYVQVRDRAGNWSRVLHDTITFE